jgi:hypothetical protein
MLIKLGREGGEFLRTSLQLRDQAEKDKPEVEVFYVQVVGSSYQYLFWLFYFR